MWRYFPEIKLLTIFVALLPCCALNGQHPAWRQYTTRDGLPDNDVNQLLQDKSGFLWIATQQGICKFNGYDFSRPDIAGPEKGVEAFLPTLDNKGLIWFARLDATLWIIDRDSVYAWKYNDVLDCYRDRFKIIESLGIDDNGTVWLGLIALGLLKVDTNGNHMVYPEQPTTCLVFAPARQQMVFTRQTNNRQMASLNIYEWPKGVMRFKPDFSYSKLITQETGVWSLRNGKLVISVDGIFYLLKDGKVEWESTRQSIFPTKVVENLDGSIIVTAKSGKNHGLFYYPTLTHFRQGQFVHMLSDQYAIDVITDKEGGWWVATYGAGIFYCKNPQTIVFDKNFGLPYSEVVRLANDGNQSIFLGFRPSTVGVIDLIKNEYRGLPPAPVTSNEIWSMYYDTLTKKLWCGNTLCYFQNEKWNTISTKHPQNKYAGGVMAKKITPDPCNALLWTSSTYGFFKVDMQKNFATAMMAHDQLPVRTFSVTPDEGGQIWVTTSDGLGLWKNNHYELPPFDHPLLRDSPRDLEFLPDSTMIFNIPGAGLLIRNKQGKFLQLTRNNGLTSDYITKLYLDQRGEIYGCSNAGLNHLIPHADGSWKIQTITTRHGLPSDQVNDITLVDGVQWIATNKGVVKFQSFAIPGSITPPIFERLSVNNHETALTPDAVFSYFENNLSIRFFALYYRLEGKIDYRYRLKGADNAFIYSNTREVNYANLQAGAYTFEVQAQDENGNWSESAQWSFIIRPAWWKTWEFWVVISLMSVVGLWFWYLNRLEDIRQKNELNSKVRSLEAAALRAQINPHFIFNCLSSIQHFIVENDPDAAIRYLARFARLVRLALHSSVDGRHSLAEEIEMLEIYLALEQLRFREKFTYSIQVEASLDPEDTEIPSMMIQPFVENALLHGMKNTNGKGEIQIEFAGKEDHILITITDNGPGLSIGAKIPEAGHKSIGITLTQRRLEILSGKTGSEPFTLENIVGPDGAILGCRVVLEVPLT